MTSRKLQTRATIGRFNERFADWLADNLATMACFWILTAMVLSTLFFQLPKTPLEWIQFIVQTVFQGLALPVLALVSNKESRRNSKLLKDTHDDGEAEMKFLKNICDGCDRIKARKNV